LFFIKSDGIRILTYCLIYEVAEVDNFQFSTQYFRIASVI